MVPLPLRLVPEFEARLERAWWRRSRSRTFRRDALMVGLGLCGLRWIEVHSLRASCVDNFQGAVRVFTAKGGVGRTVRVGLSWVSAWQASCGEPAFVCRWSRTTDHRPAIGRRFGRLSAAIFDEQAPCGVKRARIALPRRKG